MTSDPKATSRAALELSGHGDGDPSELIVDDYVSHQEPDVEPGASSTSLAAYTEMIGELRGAFSPRTIEILTQIHEGAMVATRWKFTGTHSGEYVGVAPTGRELTWTGVQIDRFEGDKIAESWVEWDKYRLFEGLGLVASD